MSNYYNNQSYKFGEARHRQQNEGVADTLKNIFSQDTLFYLDEKIINHLMDSLCLDSSRHDFSSMMKGLFNDYSFLMSPAYKALEGFLFQLANDLKLPSSANNDKIAGAYYFDEQKIDKHIDSLIKEIENKADNENKLSKYEKQDIKDRIKEMKGFLRHYRHAPAHFFGEPIETVDKAHRNIMIIYGAIDNATKILLKAGLISISNT